MVKSTSGPQTMLKVVSSWVRINLGMSVSLSACCFRNTTCKTGLRGTFSHRDKSSDYSPASSHQFRDAKALSDSILFPHCCKIKRKSMQVWILEVLLAFDITQPNGTWHLIWDFPFTQLPDAVSRPCHNSSPCLLFGSSFLGIILLAPLQRAALVSLFTANDYEIRYFMYFLDTWQWA